VTPPLPAHCVVHLASFSHYPRASMTHARALATLAAALAAVAAAAVAGACGQSAPQRIVASTGNTATTHVAPVEIHCDLRGNIVATGPTSSDVPIIVLYELGGWASPYYLPTLVVWADGTVAFSDEPFGEATHLLPATISGDDTTALARTTARLRDAPGNETLNYMTDQPAVRIVFRDGDAWRVIQVFGLTRDDAANLVRSVAAHHARRLPRAARRAADRPCQRQRDRERTVRRRGA
jgi:hypothetical protein